MNLKTKYVGEITYNEDDVIQFPYGLPGFSNELKFILLNLPGNAVFQTLQSLATPELAFIVTNPHDFYHSYEFRLDDDLLEKLQIKRKADVMIRSIVTLKDPFKNSTINLKAPLLINSKRKWGKQYILNLEQYDTKASIAPPYDFGVKAKGE